LLALVAIELTRHLLWVKMVLGLLSWVLLGLISCLLLLGLKELVQLLAEPSAADGLAHVVHLLIWVNLLHILSRGELLLLNLNLWLLELHFELLLLLKELEVVVDVGVRLLLIELLVPSS